MDVADLRRGKEWRKSRAVASNPARDFENFYEAPYLSGGFSGLCLASAPKGRRGQAPRAADYVPRRRVVGFIGRRVLSDQE